ncbi:MAG: hypothetical protein E7613_01200 [Ruminococcaceae bacterium]|nr:hypothetical protein [Oscillospiraceae bacterium]
MNFKKIKTLIFFSMAVLLCFLMLSCTSESTDKPSSQPNETPVVPNKVTVVDPEYIFVYDLNGIARVKQDDTGRITEVVTLDPITLTAPFSNDDNHISRYNYDENGNLTSFSYFGNEFDVTLTDENGRAIGALCDDTSMHITAELSYFDNGIVSEEKFYQDGKTVNINKYNEKGIPVSFFYDEFGEMTFTYSGSEVYIQIVGTDSNEMPGVTLYLNEYGYPSYSVQEAEGAVSQTRWTYDDTNRCIDAFIENTYDGMVYKEEYEIYYGDNGNIDEILYLSPDKDGNPITTKVIVYSYDKNGNQIKRSEEFRNEDGTVQKNVSTELSGDVVITTTENYSNGLVESKSVNKTEYDNEKRAVKAELFYYSASGELSSSNYSEYTYNTYGSLSKRVTDVYDKDNMHLYCMEVDYKYNDKKQVELVTYSVYGNGDELLEKEIDEFIYNDKGETVKQIVSLYDSNEKLVSVTEYDAEGNVISQK